MIYGFKKAFYDKEALDKMNSNQRAHLANVQQRGGLTFFYDAEKDELKRIQQMSDKYYIYEDDRAKDNKDKLNLVYVVAYTAYDEEGLYTEVQTFNSFEKAVESKEKYANSEINNDNTAFGWIYKEVCHGNYKEFFEQYAKENTEYKAHFHDPVSDHYINIDIFEQIVR